MKTIRKTLYVAEDGTEYETREAATKHELRCYLHRHADEVQTCRALIDSILCDPSIHIVRLTKETQRALNFKR